MKRFDDDESLTPSQVIKNFGVHLEALSIKLESIEDLLALHAYNPNSEEIRRAQRLDYVRQSLEDLSRGLHFLSRYVESRKTQRLKTNELSGLKLQITKDLFQKECAVSSNQREAGHVDIF